MYLYLKYRNPSRFVLSFVLPRHNINKMVKYTEKSETVT